MDDESPNTRPQVSHLIFCRRRRLVDPVRPSVTAAANGRDRNGDDGAGELVGVVDAELLECAEVRECASRFPNMEAAVSRWCSAGSAVDDDDGG